ncbi:MAG: arginine deiminase-related protein [Candidatus Egerieousia sp.]|nr:arginine deiminase-related protein [Candidatus Egerieousia sp.]
MQTTDKVLMIRPVRFSYNSQTAVNNAFQESGIPEELSQRQALKEFDAYVEMLRNEGIEVMVAEDTATPHTPDSIFPNNWLSLHSADELAEGASTLTGSAALGTAAPCTATPGTAAPYTANPGSAAPCSRVAVLYPMFAENRRAERRQDIIEALTGAVAPSCTGAADAPSCASAALLDLTSYEKSNLFLEGTGSLILDRNEHLAYACQSPRTCEEVLEEWSSKMGYDYFLFHAEDMNGNPIYHTNVMMSVGEQLAVVCLDAITDIEERMSLIELLEESDKEIVEISLEQMNEFAGNMLQLHTVKEGELKYIMVMSARAKDSLDQDQIEAIEKYCKIVAPDLEFIERNGGGSARCMLAEIF